MAIRIIVNGTGKAIKVAATSPETTVIDQQQQQGGAAPSGPVTTNTSDTGVTR